MIKVPTNDTAIENDNELPLNIIPKAYPIIYHFDSSSYYVGDTLYELKKSLK